MEKWVFGNARHIREKQIFRHVQYTEKKTSGCPKNQSSELPQSRRIAQSSFLYYYLTVDLKKQQFYRTNVYSIRWEWKSVYRWRVLFRFLALKINRWPLRFNIIQGEGGGVNRRFIGPIVGTLSIPSYCITLCHYTLYTHVIGFH